MLQAISTGQVQPIGLAATLNAIAAADPQSAAAADCYF